MSAASTLAPVLVLPGRGSSGPDHWQTHWEAADRASADPQFLRVQQQEWDRPVLERWLAALVPALLEHGRAQPVVLVAHSLSVSLVVHLAAAWPALAPGQPPPVRGALLVAPSDVESPHYPEGTQGFAPLPRQRLPFASTVVASTDDPRVTLARARGFAEAWGSRFEIAGALGHIGSASKLGDWPQGRRWLEDLRAGAAAAPG